MTKPNDYKLTSIDEDGLATYRAEGEPETFHKIPGAKGAGAVGDYRPIEERQADRHPSCPDCGREATISTASDGSLYCYECGASVK